jgi:hypothetical protein
MIDERLSRTFVLGAGFSRHEGFPLVCQMRGRIQRLLEAGGTNGPPATVGAGEEQYSREEFEEALRDADPPGKLELEELWIKLLEQIREPRFRRPAGIAVSALRIGCIRLFWQSIRRVQDCPSARPGIRRGRNLPQCYRFINWDLGAERMITQRNLPGGTVCRSPQAPNTETVRLDQLMGVAI